MTVRLDGDQKNGNKWSVNIEYSIRMEKKLETENIFDFDESLEKKPKINKSINLFNFSHTSSARGENANVDYREIRPMTCNESRKHWYWLLHISLFIMYALYALSKCTQKIHQLKKKQLESTHLTNLLEHSIRSTFHSINAKRRRNWFEFIDFEMNLSSFAGNTMQQTSFFPNFPQTAIKFIVRKFSIRIVNQMNDRIGS